jgi:hypothetical protein
MAKVGAKRAAELTGKSKSTIQRAMKSGKISYEVDDTGRRLIDVSELERAYGLKNKDTGKKENNNISTEGKTGVSEAEIELLKARHTLEMERLQLQNKMLNEQLGQTADMIADLKAQRDQWQKQAQQVLLTSQHSQKQSDERIAELREREEARMRRAIQHKQQLQQKSRIQNIEATKMKAGNENEKIEDAQTVKKETFGFFSTIFGKKKTA